MIEFEEASLEREVESLSEYFGKELEGEENFGLSWAISR